MLGEDWTLLTSKSLLRAVFTVTLNLPMTTNVPERCMRNGGRHYALLCGTVVCALTRQPREYVAIVKRVFHPIITGSTLFFSETSI